MVTMALESTMKLCKYISNSGLCSRRIAEKLIMNGKVHVNGVKTTSVLYDIRPEKDNIKVNTLRIYENSKFQVPKIYVTNKLAKETLIHRNNTNDNSIYKRLINLPQLSVINHMDYSSEGLTVLTDDKSFAHYMQRPYGNTPVEKQYRVRLHGILTPGKILGLSHGVTVNNIKYKPMIVRDFNKKALSKKESMKNKLKQTSGTNQWIRVITNDIHVRGVKNVFESMYCKVTRFICTNYGCYSLNIPSNGNKKQKNGPIDGDEALEMTTKNNILTDSKADPKVISPGEIIGPLDVMYNNFNATLNDSTSNTHGYEDALLQNVLNYLNLQNIRNSSKPSSSKAP